MRRIFILGLAVASFLVVTGCVSRRGETLPTGLKYQDLQVGNGDVAVDGARLEVHYTGWIYEDGKRGRKFDSSRDSGKPFSFTLGGGMVIRGWDDGIRGMRVGGKRELIIPSEMGYGARGFGAAIPPNATLDFEIELLKVGK